MTQQNPAPSAVARHIVHVRSDYRATGVWETPIGARVYAWGGHGSGKTRLLGAIRFALTGTVGDAGGYDNLGDPGRFGPDCSPDGEHLFAEVTFDNGDVASTSWTKGKEPVVIAPPWLLALGASGAERMEAVLPIQALRSGLLGRTPAAAQQWLLARAGAKITVAAVFAELPRARWAPLRRVLEGLGSLRVRGGLPETATNEEIEAAEAAEEEDTVIADLPWVLKAVADGARDTAAAVKAHATTLATAEARLSTLTVSLPGGGGVPDAAAAKAAEAKAAAAARDATMAATALARWRETHAARLNGWRLFAGAAPLIRATLAAQVAAMTDADADVDTASAVTAAMAATAAAEAELTEANKALTGRLDAVTAAETAAETAAVAAAALKLDLSAYDEPLVELRATRARHEATAVNLATRLDRGTALISLVTWQRDKNAEECVLCGGAFSTSWTWSDRHAALAAARAKAASARTRLLQEELPALDKQIGALMEGRTDAIGAARTAIRNPVSTAATEARSAAAAARGAVSAAEAAHQAAMKAEATARLRADRAAFLLANGAAALALYTAVEETAAAATEAREAHTRIATAAAGRQEAITAVREARDTLGQATDAAEALGKLKGELAGAVTRLSAAQCSALEARVQAYLPASMRFGLELGSGRAGVHVGLRQPGGRLRGQTALYGAEWLTLELAMAAAFAQPSPLLVYLPQDSYERACTGAHLAAVMDGAAELPGQVILTGLQALGLIEERAAVRRAWVALPLDEIVIGAPRVFEATEAKKGRKAAVDVAIEGVEAAAAGIQAAKRTRRKPAGTAAAAMATTEAAFQAGNIPTDMELE